MRRREFITLLGGMVAWWHGGMVAWPLPARAQHAGVLMVGLFNAVSLGGIAWQPFRQALKLKSTF